MIVFENEWTNMYFGVLRNNTKPSSPISSKSFFFDVFCKILVRIPHLLILLYCCNIKGIHFVNDKTNAIKKLRRAKHFVEQ